MMNAKEAVTVAKRAFLETFESEGLSQLALEEIDFEDASESWLITLSFLRPVDRTKPSLDRLLPGFPSGDTLERIYRVVRINDADGKLASIKIRELAA